MSAEILYCVLKCCNNQILCLTNNLTTLSPALSSRIWVLVQMFNLAAILCLNYVGNKVSRAPFSRHLTLALYLHISLQMLGEGQLIRELKLSGINHNRVREWVMYQKACITWRPSCHQRPLKFEGSLLVQAPNFARLPLKSHFHCTPPVWVHSLSLDREAYFSHLTTQS
jgi:hypothetical protein